MKKRDIALLISGLATIALVYRSWSLRTTSQSKILEASKEPFPFATTEALSMARYPPEGRDTFKINELVSLCHYGVDWTIDKKSVLVSASNMSIKAQKLAYLGDCRPLEFVIHQDGRSMGHCSDFAQYILHADARLSPEFDEQTYKRKLKLCPRTTYLHFERARSFFFSNSSTHRNWWVPNIEQISKLEVGFFPRTSKFLCKSRIACTTIQKYLNATNLLRSQKNSEDVYDNASDLEYSHTAGQRLVYVSHSSTDVVDDGNQVLGAKRVSRLKQDFSQFLHIHGTSGRKHTRELYNCWKEHPEWPKLTIIGNKDKQEYETDPPTEGPMPENIQVFTRLRIEQLRELQLSIGIHICPSSQEGYGHYINEARSLGALVLTTNHPPMNEFVVDAVSGILLNHDTPSPEEYQLLAPYFVSPVHVEPKHICDAVARVLKEYDVEKRREMGRRARLAFEYDTYVMKTNMAQLKDEAYSYFNGESE
ncbi:UNVERIFIED_CONTAM: hypothetical protein HDU68_003263 [Siphonaria sp. JEL0065]|nr:hypothetical protein HDU68_003263 [Siphonaria sp. JEL0065]